MKWKERTKKGRKRITRKHHQRKEKPERGKKQKNAGQLSTKRMEE